MTSPATTVALHCIPGSVGLIEDLPILSHGKIRLKLAGYRHDPERDLPLYLFDVVTESGEVAGQYHFTPGAEDRVGDIGNSGGHVDQSFRNRGLSSDAIRALKPLASLHGMQSFVITCGKDNGAAQTALRKLGVEYPQEQLFKYRIPADHSSPIDAP